MIVFFQIGLLLCIGFAGGLAVGGAFVAFLVVLDIIPRLAQLSKSVKYMQWIEGSVILGAVLWTLFDFFDWSMHFFPMGAAVIGSLCGVFVGMLAAALTEVLNVLPILAKRLQIGDYLIWILMSMVLGKIVGSLFDWIVF